MATRSSERNGLAGAARGVADHATAIARLELRLAIQEIKRKVARLAAGGILLGAAGLFGWFALQTGIAAGIAGIALVLPVWLALLIVFGFFALLAGLLGGVGLLLLKRGAPPVPEQAIEEARLTTEAVKNGHH
ncbi:MAG: phage holin family protein [Gaiellaceae bacterium]